MQPTKSCALIGVGRWGKNLARNLFQLGYLHTLCDLSLTSLQAYEKEFPGVHLSTSLDEVLKNEEIKQVMIATTAPTHYEVAKQALLFGKDLFVEKPLCLDVRHAEELIQLAESKQRILMVGHLLQYHPCVSKLQEMVAAGTFGKLHSIVSHRLNLGSIRTEENVLWSFAPHDISVLLSLVGDKGLKEVRCTGGAFLSKGIHDSTSTYFAFEEGVQAQIFSSWIHPFKEQKLVVIGSKGMAVFDDTLPWEQKLCFFPDVIEWKEGKIPQASPKKAQMIALPHAEPLKQECLHFFECCFTRKSPKTDGKEGLLVLEVLHAAQKSLETGEAVYIPKEKTSYFSHETAVIDAGAEISKDSKIWHFSHIMAGAVIGPKCNIGQNVVVSPNVFLGKNVKVQNNVSIYSGVTCEDDVFLGPSCVFTNVLTPRSAVNRRDSYVPTLVRKGATIGANATIVCGVELGEHCMVGAGAVVTKNVKPFALMVGNPARQIGWVSRHGERLDLPVSLPSEKTQKARCPITEELYLLEGETVTQLKEALVFA